LYVPATSLAQKKAIRVCSGVRVVELAEPSDFTSLTCAAYSGLASRAGSVANPPGGGGRNWLPEASVNGVTRPQFGVAAGPEPVGRHWPGNVPGV
jgi:hypothetical protein